MNSENVLTYPPSMCFFGNDTLLIPAGVQKFIEDKKATLRARMEYVMTKVIKQGLKIGDTKLEFEEGNLTRPNTEVLQSQLLEEIQLQLHGTQLIIQRMKERRFKHWL
jgi:hypothetical protein